jgi:predicted RNA-binding protein with RPS1 domain
VLVKVINIDPSGKIRLSRKALIEQAQGGDAGSAGGNSGGGQGEPRQEERRPGGGEHRPRRDHGPGRGRGDHRRDR